MLITITTWAGAKLDAMLLYFDGTAMRVAIPGYDDAVSFYYKGGQWLAESGEVVELRMYSSPGENTAACSGSV